MHTLSTYLKSAGIRQAEMAGTLGISRGYMSELAGGSKAPSRILAIKIEQATGGNVRVSSWDHNSLHANAPAAHQAPLGQKSKRPVPKGRAAQRGRE